MFQVSMYGEYSSKLRPTIVSKEVNTLSTSKSSQGGILYCEKHSHKSIGLVVLGFFQSFSLLPVETMEQGKKIALNSRSMTAGNKGIPAPTSSCNETIGDSG